MEKSDRITNELIGLIYETAKEPNIWPILLGGLSSVVNNEDAIEHFNQADNIYQLAVGNGNFSHSNVNNSHQAIQDELAQNLLPHFQRAFEINKQLSEALSQRDNASSVLERLPLGVIMVKADGTVISKNNQADQILSTENHLKIINNIICTDDSIETRSLHKLIKSTAVKKTNQTKSHTFSLKHDNPLSILITPASPNAPVFMGEDMCSLLIATSEIQQAISQEILMELYNLSPAEARLTQLLIKGKSVEEITTKINISRHTVKTQLKSIFQKTDTHRQAELIGKILTSPAVLLNKSHQNKTDLMADSYQYSFQHEAGLNEHLITLKDGRSLCYIEYGNLTGKPVLFFHSLIASRLQGPPNSSQLKKLNIRLIVPDRPGYGKSTHKPDRSLLDWAHDVEELADQLQLDKFYIAGYSAGGPHAAACAYYLPDRCIRLGLISSMWPFESLKELTGMRPSVKMVLALARHSPKLLLPFLRIMAKSIHKDPSDYIKRLTSDWAKSDLNLLKNPYVMAELSDCFREAVRNGTDGLFNEHFLLAKLWGFKLSEIKSETMIWHGEIDTIVPFETLNIVKQIPNNTLTSYPNEGHLLLLEHWQEIFKDLIQ